MAHDVKDRILVIDDEQIIRTMLRDTIEMDLDVEVIAVPDGKTGLAIIQRETVDLIITDVRMPGLSGIDVLREVKYNYPEIPVILISGYTDAENTMEALQLGAANFFTKPFMLSDIKQTIKKVLSARHISQKTEVLQDFLAEESKTYTIPNDPECITPLIKRITVNLSSSGIMEEQDVMGIVLALNEIILNAIEHGNLGISYEEKALLIREGNYDEELKRRAAMPEYADRVVTIHYSLERDKVTYVIQDEGEGFDHKNLPNPTDIQNLHEINGRGILIAGFYVDELIYNDKGNEVTLIKYKTSGKPKAE